MWVSRRTDYATQAVLALAIADGGPLRLEEIVEATGAPRSVLAQVMTILRHGGVVRWIRGPGGGHGLNRPAEAMTSERVLRLSEGQLPASGYDTRGHHAPCGAVVYR